MFVSCVLKTAKMKPGPELLVKLKKVNVHSCEKCPKVFPSLSELLKHKSYHYEYFLSHVVSAYVSVEKAKIFICDKCTQSFVNNRDFMLHKLTHIQETVRNERKGNILQNPAIEKPYKCPDCEVSYAAKCTLDAHSVLHLPFPHICECGIGYYKQQDLKAHMKLVHGTRNYEEDILHQKEEKVIPQEKPVVITPSKPKSKSMKSPTAKGTLRKKKCANGLWKQNVPAEVLKSYKPKNESDIPEPDVHFRRTSDKQFEFPECKKSFRDKGYAIVHYRVHSGERPHTCHLCSKSFSQGITLRLHLERHVVTEKAYACRYCPKTFTFASYRDRHEDIHSAVKPHECPFCGKGFHDPSAMARHKRIHTGDKRYQCPYCPQAFTDISGLNGHKLRHENKKKFQCQICGKRFYGQSFLKQHMRVHTHEKSVACDYCKKWYSSKTSLITHIQIMHEIVKKKFECDLCNHKFVTKDYLQKHLQRVHHNRNKTGPIKKLKCNVCLKKFYTKCTLREHKYKFHLGIRCEKCSRYFETQAHLKAHILVESVQCEKCDMRFICENMKEKHLKVHYAKSVKTIKRDSDSLNV